MAILVIQRGAKIVLFKRETDPASGAAVDVDVAIWSGDEAERHANAVLAMLSRVREQEAEDAKTGLSAIEAELKAARDNVARLEQKLQQTKIAASL
jgi:hypothetical protein